MSIRAPTRPRLASLSVSRLSELLAAPFPYMPSVDSPASMLSHLFYPAVRARPPDRIWPKLRNDVIYVLYRDGVLFRCDRQGVFLRGPFIYSLITYLGPWLTGEFCLEDMLSGLDAESRRKLDAFIRLLAESGIVSINSPAPDAGLDPKLGARFARQLEVVDALGGDAAQRFLAFRNSRVLLVGSGLSFGACAASLLRSGARQIVVFDTDGNDKDLELAAREAAALSAAGINSSIVRVHHRTDEAGATAGAFDIVAYCSDCGQFNDVCFLNRAVAQAGCRFLPGLVVGQRSYMGPIIGPWCPGCWACSILRVTDDRKSDGGPDFRALAVANFAQPAKADGTIATALGKDMAFEVMKILAGHLRHLTDHGMVMQTLRPSANIEMDMASHSLSACSNFCAEFVNEPETVVARLRAVIGTLP